MRRLIVCAAALAALLTPPAALGHGFGPQGPATDEAVSRTAERQPNGLFRVTTEDGAVLNTHGGDPRPGHGGGLGPGDPELAPACATDYYQHVLYGRPRRARDRLAEVGESLRAQIRRNTHVLDESSRASGGPGALYKVRCTAGVIDVGSFVVKNSSSDFSTIVNAARAAGYNLANVDYTIFYDGASATACGVGSYYSDERATAANLNNNGGGYGITYRDCWYGRTSMHENGHNQGAVQPGAPQSTGSGAHCNDLLDVMCYAPDGGNQNQTEVTLCATVIWFDCNFDTYFDTAPEAGEWLASHWNLGSSVNRFIALQ